MTDPNDLHLARLLRAAACAIETAGAYRAKDAIVKAVHEVQAALKPPAGTETWRSHDGRVMRVQEMTNRHLLNALALLLRQLNDGEPAPMAPVLEAEVRRRWARNQFRGFDIGRVRALLSWRSVG